MTTSLTACDFLIHAAHLLPVAPDNIALSQWSFAVTDGAIVEVGPRISLEAQFEPEQVLDFDHHIVLPGLINAHGHAAMTLLRGAGEDQSLQAWLTDTIWPLEARLMNTEFVRLGTTLAIAEMMKSGTTMFSDMYFFPEVVAATAKSLGMRCQIAFPIIEMKNAYSENVDECFHKGLALHDAYRHDELVKTAFGPHAPYTVSHDSLTKVGMYANELDSCVQIHVHENAQEVKEAHQNLGYSNIALLRDTGLLGPHVQAVHMTVLDDEDFAMIEESRTQVVHCPSSNMKLASGYCTFEKFRAAGLNLSLGTDGAASNNHLDLFAETRLATLLAKHENLDPTAAPAAEMIKTATLGGANALGVGDLVGSIEPGKRADFVAVDVNRLNLLPLHDPFAALVHGGAGHAVDTVCIDGRLCVQDAVFTHLDGTELIAAVQTWQREAGL